MVPRRASANQNNNRSQLLETALGIFINGITGVFIGMTVLYLAMKLIALIAKDRSDPEKTD